MHIVAPRVGGKNRGLRFRVSREIVVLAMRTFIGHPRSAGGRSGSGIWPGSVVASVTAWELSAGGAISLKRVSLPATGLRGYATRAYVTGWGKLRCCRFPSKVFCCASCRAGSASRIADLIGQGPKTISRNRPPDRVRRSGSFPAPGLPPMRPGSQPERSSPGDIAGLRAAAKQKAENRRIGLGPRQPESSFIKGSAGDSVFAGGSQLNFGAMSFSCGTPRPARWPALLPQASLTDKKGFSGPCELLINRWSGLRRTAVEGLTPLGLGLSCGTAGEELHVAPRHRP